MANLIDQYRRWFEYELEAHRKTLDSLRGVAADRNGSDEWQRAVQLFAHLIMTRQVWLFRMGGPVAEPTDYFPEGKSIDELAAMAEASAVAWSSYYEGLTSEELARVCDYVRSDGVGFRNSVEDTLVHLFGHSFYHRGQIAALVRAMGGTPAATDYIFSVREKI
jgi:uncharacterized damage-inducible protein DinB